MRDLIDSVIVLYFLETAKPVLRLLLHQTKHMHSCHRFYSAGADGALRARQCELQGRVADFGDGDFLIVAALDDLACLIGE